MLTVIPVLENKSLPRLEGRRQDCGINPPVAVFDTCSGFDTSVIRRIDGERQCIQCLLNACLGHAQALQSPRPHHGKYSTLDRPALWVEK